MKYAKKKSRRLRWSKQAALLAAITLVLTMAVGGVLAFLTTNSAPVVNTFTPSKVNIKVDEDFDGEVKNNVRITLSADSVKAKIRAMVVVTWQNDAGNVYPAAPVEGEDFEMTWTKGGWTGSGMGWFEHGAIEPGASTGILFTDCKPLNACPDPNYKLVVDVIAEAIQDGGGADW